MHNVYKINLFEQEVPKKNKNILFILKSTEIHAENKQDASTQSDELVKYFKPYSSTVGQLITRF